MVDLPRTGRGGDHDHPGGGRSLQRLLEPFDVQILGYDPWIDLGVFAERRIESVDLETLFAQSDVVYVLAAPTASNHHLVSRELMNLLDPADIPVVISRAHRLRSARGAVLSTHRAGAISQALFEIGRMVIDDLETLLAGGDELRMQYATPELVRRLQ